LSKDQVEWRGFLKRYRRTILRTFKTRGELNKLFEFNPSEAIDFYQKEKSKLMLRKTNIYKK
jgi:hypothetical protein